MALGTFEYHSPEDNYREHMNHEFWAAHDYRMEAHAGLYDTDANLAFEAEIERERYEAAARREEAEGAWEVSEAAADSTALWVRAIDLASVPF